MRRRRSTLRRMPHLSQTQVLIWIVVLLVLEYNHFRWIWWEHWACRRCGEKHKACACSRKWLMEL